MTLFINGWTLTHSPIYRGPSYAHRKAERMKHIREERQERYRRHFIFCAGQAHKYYYIVCARMSQGDYRSAAFYQGQAEYWQREKEACKFQWDRAGTPLNSRMVRGKTATQVIVDEYSRD